MKNLVTQRKTGKNCYVVQRVFKNRTFRIGATTNKAIAENYAMRLESVYNKAILAAMDVLVRGEAELSLQMYRERGQARIDEKYKDFPHIGKAQNPAQPAEPPAADTFYNPTQEEKQRVQALYNPAPAQTEVKPTTGRPNGRIQREQAAALKAQKEK
jgi:hypothetical protein